MDYKGYITNSILTGNISQNGGGIAGGCVMINTYVVKNYATNQGGGIYGFFIIRNSVIADNYCISTLGGGEGGGIYLTQYSLLDSVSIVNNYNNSEAAGIYYEGGTSFFNRVTMSNNRSLSQTDGFFFEFTNNDIAEFRNSNLCYNGFSYYNNSPNAIMPADSNWWGHSSGPYHPIQNPSGLGDSANIYVNVIPFLTEPNSEAPPIPVQNISFSTLDTNQILLTWDESPINDIAGYKVHYDTDSTNVFYANSIDVGDTTEYELDNLQTGITYYISATCYDLDGNESWYCKPLVIELAPPTIYNDNNKKILSFSLIQNYPNPFNPTTTINYQIPEFNFVTLKVYDVLGSEVATLVNKEKPVGSYEVEFDASTLSSGIYFYRLQAGSFIETKKMVLLR